MPDFQFVCDHGAEECVISGPGARITFVRSGDRWTHDLNLGVDSAASDVSQTIASTVETPSDHDDPTRIISPVYQELHRHEFSGDKLRGICLLLTGRLFQHHFSAAVSHFLDPAEPEFVVLDYDIADRCRSPVSALAATYLVRLGSSDLVDADSSTISWAGPNLGPGVNTLELRCDPPGSLALAEAGRQATRVQALAAIHPTLFTHRLRYRWRWRWREAQA